MTIATTKESAYDDLEKWYIKERVIYDHLGEKVASLIKELLDANGVEYHSVTSRAKEVDSVVKKAKLKKYKNPITDIQDFAGIRVITFVKSDVLKACDLIKPQFTIDEENSSDKGKELGEDRVGYRSVHYVATFGDDRIILPEYKRFEGLCFEIQIRTILEHAWADISHDRTYKFNNNLTDENDIRRRFALAAASLELVDREFDRLANEIDTYSSQIANTVDGDLNYVIDGTSIIAYLESRFGEDIEIITLNNETINEGIEELNIMGLYTLADLDKVIKELVDDNIFKLVENEEEVSLIGLLRNILILKFKDEYFEKAWRNSWSGISNEDVYYFKQFNLDIVKLATKYDCI